MNVHDIETAIERRRRQWDAYTERQRAKRIKQAAYHLESFIAARKFIAAGGMKPVFIPEDPEELAALLPAPEPAEGPIVELVAVEPAPAPVEPPVDPRPIIVKPPPLCQRILDALKTVPSANCADLAVLVGEPTTSRVSASMFYLMEENKVQIIGDKPNRRNRPTNLYALTKREEAHHVTA